MDYKDYSQTVKYFKNVYPFAERQWRYTRNLGNLKRIVYDEEWERLPNRIRHTFKMFASDPKWLKEINRDGGIKSRISHKYYILVVGLRRNKHLPDGIMENASVLTHWEEEGEYIQLVSPAVGDILVEWLENDSENPYAQRVVEKMKEILDDYFERANNG